jgi:hypothetical protein
VAGVAPKVEIYILHCESPNGDALLRETLESLIRSDYENFQIKVIENGCSVPWLHWSGRINNPTNVGVAEGYNVGLGAGSSPYVLLINNDVAVNPEMVSRLIAIGEADSTIGIVAPRIYYYGTRKVWSDGGLFNPWTGVTRHKNIRKIGPADKTPKEVDWATGCCLLIKREVIQVVGEFDSAYSPAYCEDVDYCMRTRAAGWKIVVNPRATMWHKISQSIDILKAKT